MIREWNLHHHNADTEDDFSETSHSNSDEASNRLSRLVIRGVPKPDESPQQQYNTRLRAQLVDLRIVTDYFSSVPMTKDQLAQYQNDYSALRIFDFQQRNPRQPGTHKAVIMRLLFQNGNTNTRRWPTELFYLQNLETFKQVLQQNGKLVFAAAKALHRDSKREVVPEFCLGLQSALNAVFQTNYQEPFNQFDKLFQNWKSLPAPAPECQVGVSKTLTQQDREFIAQIRQHYQHHFDKRSYFSACNLITRPSDLFNSYLATETAPVQSFTWFHLDIFGDSDFDSMKVKSATFVVQLFNIAVESQLHVWPIMGAVDGARKKEILEQQKTFLTSKCNSLKLAAFRIFNMLPQTALEDADKLLDCIAQLEKHRASQTLVEAIRVGFLFVNHYSQMQVKSMVGRLLYLYGANILSIMKMQAPLNENYGIPRPFPYLDYFLTAPGISPALKHPSRVQNLLKPPYFTHRCIIVESLLSESGQDVMLDTQSRHIGKVNLSKLQDREQKFFPTLFLVTSQDNGSTFNVLFTTVPSDCLMFDSEDAKQYGTRDYLCYFHKLLAPFRFTSKTATPLRTGQPMTLTKYRAYGEMLERKFVDGNEVLYDCLATLRLIEPAFNTSDIDVFFEATGDVLTAVAIALDERGHMQLTFCTNIRQFHALLVQRTQLYHDLRAFYFDKQGQYSTETAEYREASTCEHQLRQTVKTDLHQQCHTIQVTQLLRLLLAIWNYQNHEKHCIAMPLLIRKRIFDSSLVGGTLARLDGPYRNIPPRLFELIDCDQEYRKQQLQGRQSSTAKAAQPCQQPATVQKSGKLGQHPNTYQYVTNSRGKTKILMGLNGHSPSTGSQEARLPTENADTATGTIDLSTQTSTPVQPVLQNPNANPPKQPAATPLGLTNGTTTANEVKLPCSQRLVDNQSVHSQTFGVSSSNKRFHHQMIDLTGDDDLSAEFHQSSRKSFGSPNFEIGTTSKIPPRLNPEHVREVDKLWQNVFLSRVERAAECQDQSVAMLLTKFSQRYVQKHWKFHLLFQIACGLFQDPRDASALCVEVIDRFLAGMGLTIDTKDISKALYMLDSDDSSSDEETSDSADEPEQDEPDDLGKRQPVRGQTRNGDAVRQTQLNFPRTSGQAPRRRDNV